MENVVTATPKIHSNPTGDKATVDTRNETSKGGMGSDSPTLSCTTMNSSVLMDDADHNPHHEGGINNNNNNCGENEFDEENLTPVPTRMGRTIVVSNEHRDDETNTVDSAEEMEQERQWLIEQALETLSKLAAMESSDYQERLVENSLPRIALLEEDSVALTSSLRSTPNRRPHRRRLITPSSRQKMEDTQPTESQNDCQEAQQRSSGGPAGEGKLDLQLPNYSSTATTGASSSSSLPSLTSKQPRDVVSKLSQSIHRFHSLLLNLTKENDIQTCELVDLQRELDAERQNSAKLQAVVKKLHKKNVKLTDKLARNKSLGRQLVERVTKQKQQQDQEEVDSKFWKMACQVSHHEQALLKRQQQQLNGGSVSGIESGCSSPVSHRDRTASDMSGDYLDGLQDFVNCESQSRSMDTSCDLDLGDRSIASQHSLVTDEGIATVKIHRERTMTWPNVLRPSKSKDEDENKKTKTTDQDQAKEVPPSTGSSSSGATKSNNPFAAFLAPMKQKPQPYTLTFIKPYALQVAKIPLPAVSSAEDSPYESHSASSEVAYAICGYHGLDTDVNVKPTLGARLMCINGIPIDGAGKQWSSVEAVETAIASHGRSISLTFRNDVWNKAQKERLQAAIHDQSMKHPQSNRMQSFSDTLFGDGASSGKSDAADATAGAGTRRRTNSNDLASLVLLGVGGAGGGNSERRVRNDRSSSPSVFPAGGGNGPQKNILGFLNFNHHGGGAGGGKNHHIVGTGSDQVRSEPAPRSSEALRVPSLTKETAEMDSSKSLPPSEQTSDTQDVLEPQVIPPATELGDDDGVCVVEEPATPKADDAAVDSAATVAGTDTSQSEGNVVAGSENDVKQEPVIVSSETVKSAMSTEGTNGPPATTTPPRNTVNRANNTPPPSAEKFMKNMGKLFSFGN